MTRGGRSGRFGGVRALAALAGVVAGAGALSVAACLVDLPVNDPVDASVADAATGSMDARTAPPRCGDGIIQIDAGEVCDPGADAGAVSSAVSSCSADCATILCPAGGFVWTKNDHCYFALDAGEVSMGTAVSGCSAQGAHVVTFDDDEEQSAVDVFLGDAGGPYWIALTQDAVQANPIYDVVGINEPGWRKSCSGCYGPRALKTEASFLDVCNLATSAPCVAHVPSNAAFFGVSCTGACGTADAASSVNADAGADAGVPSVSAVCEREPAGVTGQSCDDGGVCFTVTVTSATSTYELVMAQSAQLTWADAQAACAQKTGANGRVGGHLVIFQTPEERSQVSRELSARLQAGALGLTYWVGLQNLGDSGAGWTWLDGTPATGYALEWADGEPNPVTGPLAYGQVEFVPESTTFDRQLLHADPTVGEDRPFVCEFEGP